MSRTISTEDRIGSLQDPILCHILSFLPTKFAATTTILSKRWNPLWLSVPTLYFDDIAFRDRDSFNRFVSSVFLLRDIMLPLRSFHLKFSDPYHKGVDINQFVHAAVQRGGIENFSLEINNYAGPWSNVVKLPSRIFSFKTLVVLHLRGIIVNDFSHVIVNFPRLKTLHLSSVIFPSVKYLPKLLSKCPILEELNINHLFPAAPQILVLDENFECLQNLMKAFIYRFSFSVDVLFTLCCRAKVLRVQLDMRYRWNTRYSQFPMHPNLTYMELILKNNSSEKWNWLLEVLIHCPKLQILIIQEDSIVEDEVVDNWMDPSIVPECLSAQLKTCFLKGFKSTEFAIQFAKYIIQNSKVLSAMSIKCSSTLDINVKYQVITNLALSKRASTTCELLFE